MIKQNINLITSLPARQSIYLSFRFIKVVYLSFVGFLLVIYFLYFIVDYSRRDDLVRITKERVTLNNEIESIVAKSKKMNESQGLLESINALKAKIEAQERVLKLLNTQQQSRFSVYLETIADQIPEKTWLNRMEITPEKERVFLSGYTLEAPLVSEFVHRLSNSAVFGAYHFKSVDLKGAKENYFQFVITSESVLPTKTKGAGAS